MDARLSLSVPGSCPRYISALMQPKMLYVAIASILILGSLLASVGLCSRFNMSPFALDISNKESIAMVAIGFSVAMTAIVIIGTLRESKHPKPIEHSITSPSAPVINHPPLSIVLAPTVSRADLIVVPVPRSEPITPQSQQALQQLCASPYEFYNQVKTQQQTAVPDTFSVTFMMLGVCPCKKMTPPMRMALENHCVSLLASERRKDERITVVSMGPGQTYQEFVYLAKLVQAGFKNLQLVLIDPNPVPVGALNRLIKESLDATIGIITYTNIDNYVMDAQENSQLQPHLLLLIDLDDKKYCVDGMSLTDYSFCTLQTQGILTPSCTIAYSKLVRQAEENSFIPQAIACSYQGEGELDAIAAKRMVVEGEKSLLKM